MLNARAALSADEGHCVSRIALVYTGILPPHLTIETWPGGLVRVGYAVGEVTVTEEIWGPWVSHDGLGCPVAAGTIVEVLSRDGFGFDKREIGLASGEGETSWNWSHYPRLKKIIRYRVKRPRGLTMLTEVMENIPTKAPKQPVDA